MAIKKRNVWQKYERSSSDFHYYHVALQEIYEFRTFENVDENGELSLAKLEENLSKACSHPVPQLIDDGKKVLAQSRVPNEKLTSLPMGCYLHRPSQMGIPERLEPLNLRGDTFWDECSQVLPEIIEDVNLFCKSEAIYRKIGRSYRRSYLLYGPPGNGKTSIIRHLIKTKIPQSFVIWVDRGLPSTEMLEALAVRDPGQFLVFVFEDINRLLKESNGVVVSALLRLLDGEESPDRCIVFGTTNNPEELEKALSNRPGRFDRVVMVNDPNSSARKNLLHHLLGITPSEECVRASEGLSISAIQEACLRQLLSGVPFPQAVADLKGHAELVKRDFRVGGRVGIQ